MVSKLVVDCLEESGSLCAGSQSHLGPANKVGMITPKNERHLANTSTLGRSEGDEDRLVDELSSTNGLVVSPLSVKSQIHNLELSNLTGCQSRVVKRKEERLWDECKRKLIDLKGMSEASVFLEPVEWTGRISDCHFVRISLRIRWTWVQ